MGLHLKSVAMIDSPVSSTIPAFKSATTCLRIVLLISTSNLSANNQADLLLYRAAQLFFHVRSKQLIAVLFKCFGDFI
ncbi:hypothetical protein UG53_04155, partial [Vibrio sp. S512-13]